MSDVSSRPLFYFVLTQFAIRKTTTTTACFIAVVLAAFTFTLTEGKAFGVVQTKSKPSPLVENVTVSLVSSAFVSSAIVEPKVRFSATEDWGSENHTLATTAAKGVFTELLEQERVLVTVYYSVVIVMSLLSNGTIGLVFYKKPQLLTVSNNFVLNLACCQLGLSLLVLPFTATSVARGEWIFSDTWCRAQSYLLVVLTVALHYSLLVISLDRNYAIVNSLRYPYVFTHLLGNTFIAGTWIIGLIVGLPPLLGWGTFKFDKHQYLCGVDWRADSGYTFFFLGVVIVFPLLVQCWCYLSIFHAALGHTKRAVKVYPSSATTTTTSTTATPDNATTTTTTTTTTTNSSDSGHEDGSQPPPARAARSTECKAVKTILLIAVTYFVCWTLFVVVAVCKSYNEVVFPSTDMAAAALVFLSCILNPVIYAFMNRVTRFEIWKFWSKVSQRVSGRPPVPFTDSDDPMSSTWTTTVSSSRQPSGLWVTPGQRTRRGSKTLPCALRHLEMVTIKEESEIEDDTGRDEDKNKAAGSSSSRTPQTTAGSSSSAGFQRSLSLPRSTTEESAARKPAVRSSDRIPNSRRKLVLDPRHLTHDLNLHRKHPHSRSHHRNSVDASKLETGRKEIWDLFTVVHTTAHDIESSCTASSNSSRKTDSGREESDKNNSNNKHHNVQRGRERWNLLRIARLFSRGRNNQTRQDVDNPQPPPSTTTTTTTTTTPVGTLPTRASTTTHAGDNSVCPKQASSTQKGKRKVLVRSCSDGDEKASCKTTHRNGSPQTDCSASSRPESDVFEDDSVTKKVTSLTGNCRRHEHDVPRVKRKSQRVKTMSI